MSAAHDRLADTAARAAAVTVDVRTAHPEHDDPECMTCRRIALAAKADADLTEVLSWKVNPVG